MKHFKKWVLWIFFFCTPLCASNLEYAIIIDAGSSGSRLHIFSYEKMLPMIELPIIKEEFSSSVKPGLSSYANKPSLAGPSLEPLLNRAQDYFRNSSIEESSVPISVLATAGMRLLPIEQQSMIYDSVRNTIHGHYGFSLEDNNVRTITGEMEGIYGWLDVNYLLNNFQEGRKTVGSIDMGGASTELTFETTDASHPDNMFHLVINHQPYDVFAITFLRLGQDQARQMMTKDKDADQCYPKGFSFDTRTGDFHEFPCASIYAHLIEVNQVAQKIVPTRGNQFIAFAAIYRNFNFFKILNSPTKNALESRIHAVCSLSWTELLKEYPDVPMNYLSEYCANGVYFDNLLYNTYQLNAQHQLQVKDKLNQQEIDWTLGALLYQLTQ